jgi:CubicO group peptidase (beta-lactamase class C family)
MVKLFKLLRIILRVLIFAILAINIYVLINGDWYFYKVIGNTIMKGRLGPTIDEYRKDDLALIQKGNSHPHPKAKDYNQRSISKPFQDYVNNYGTIAFVVLRNDSLVHEEYWDKWNEDSLSNSYSMAKSVVSLLVGCALHDGSIKSVDESICTYLPDFNCDQNKTVTIKNLLTMSSAIDFDESYISPFAFSAEALYTDHLREATYQHKLIGTPGKQFDYESGNTELLCLILEKATGKKLADYASEKLWSKMGVEKNAYWSLDREKQARAFCCFISNAKDFARFGTLINHHGKLYNQQLVDSAYIAEATAPNTSMMDEDGKPCKKYGYQFWMVDYKGLHIKYYRGILGQYIIAIPEKNMVAVRLGKQRSKEKIDGHPKDVFLIIDETLDLLGKTNQ